MRVHNVEERGKQAQKNKKVGGKKRAEGAFKKGGSRKSMSPCKVPGRTRGKDMKSSGSSGGSAGKKSKGSKKIIP